MRPLVKSFLRQISPMATQKLKELGSKLITSGGTVLSHMADKKRQKVGAGHVTNTAIKSVTPASASVISPKQSSVSLQPTKKRKKRGKKKKEPLKEKKKKKKEKKKKKKKKKKSIPKKRRKTKTKREKGKAGGKKKAENKKE